MMIMTELRVVLGTVLVLVIPAVAIVMFYFVRDVFSLSEYHAGDATLNAINLALCSKMGWLLTILLYGPTSKWGGGDTSCKLWPLLSEACIVLCPARIILWANVGPCDFCQTWGL